MVLYYLMFINGTGDNEAKGTQRTCSGKKLFRTRSRIPGKFDLFWGVFVKSNFFKFQKEGFICLETQWNWLSVLLEGPSNVWNVLIIYRPSNSPKIGKYFWSPGWQIKTGVWKIETSKITQIMEKMCNFGKISCICPLNQK